LPALGHHRRHLLLGVVAHRLDLERQLRLPRRRHRVVGGLGVGGAATRGPTAALALAARGRGDHQRDQDKLLHVVVPPSPPPSPRWMPRARSFLCKLVRSMPSACAVREMFHSYSASFKRMNSLSTSSRNSRSDFCAYLPRSIAVTGAVDA